MPDFLLPLDWRFVLAIAAVVIAGIAKGVTGMGLPVAGVPILVGLYGNLRDVLVATILGTAMSDLPILWRFRKQAGDLRSIVGFVIAGAIGMVIGTHILGIVRPVYLSAILAIVLVVVITVSWLGRIPTMSQEIARKIGPIVGIFAGMLQGAAGASGPVVTSYLLSMKLPRASFLFTLNAIFLVLDWTQFVSLQQYTTDTFRVLSIGVMVLTLAGLAVGLAIQKHINDVVFRRGVLIMLSLAALGLIARALHG